MYGEYLKPRVGEDDHVDSGQHGPPTAEHSTMKKRQGLLGRKSSRSSLQPVRMTDLLPELRNIMEMGVQDSRHEDEQHRIKDDVDSTNLERPHSLPVNTSCNTSGILDTGKDMNSHMKPVAKMYERKSDNFVVLDAVKDLNSHPKPVTKIYERNSDNFLRTVPQIIVTKETPIKMAERGSAVPFASLEVDKENMFTPLKSAKVATASREPLSVLPADKQAIHTSSSGMEVLAGKVPPLQQPHQPTDTESITAQVSSRSEMSKSKISLEQQPEKVLPHELHHASAGMSTPLPSQVEKASGCQSLDQKFKKHSGVETSRCLDFRTPQQMEGRRMRLYGVSEVPLHPMVAANQQLQRQQYWDQQQRGGSTGSTLSSLPHCRPDVGTPAGKTLKTSPSQAPSTYPASSEGHMNQVSCGRSSPVALEHSTSTPVSPRSVHPQDELSAQRKSPEAPVSHPASSCVRGLSHSDQNPSLGKMPHLFEGYTLDSFAAGSSSRCAPDAGQPKSSAVPSNAVLPPQSLQSGGQPTTRHTTQEPQSFSSLGQPASSKSSTVPNIAVLTQSFQSEGQRTTRHATQEPQSFPSLGQPASSKSSAVPNNAVLTQSFQSEGQPTTRRTTQEPQSFPSLGQPASSKIKGEPESAKLHVQPDPPKMDGKCLLPTSSANIIKEEKQASRDAVHMPPPPPKRVMPVTSAAMINCEAGVRKLGTDKLVVNGKLYTVLSQLGRGGSSVVYQVYDPISSRLLAVKCVDLSGVDKSICEGYLNEIQLLGQLQGSDCVITMFDYEHRKEDQLLYVVMEKGDTDLSSLLRKLCRQKKISTAMIVYYWTEMLNAVSFIHSRGTIHSDLKPANFLLVSGRLKLIDFGIASSIQGDMTSVIKDSMTGTFNYISPEALKGTCGPYGSGQKFKITCKSDVWSLGCILYNLVYGHTPFQAITNQFQKMNAIVDPEHKIPFPTPPIDDCPPTLIQAMKACLNRNPKERSSVDELLQLPYLGQGGSEKALLTQIAKLAVSVVVKGNDSPESAALLSIQKIIRENEQIMPFSKT